MIKNIEELKALRDSMKPSIGTADHSPDEIRVVVGMATCGIAAGAGPVYNELTKELAKRNLKNIAVVQTGCIGICQYEPVVEVYMPGEKKVTYVKMAPEMVAKVVSDHLVNHKPVSEYTIGAQTE